MGSILSQLNAISAMHFLRLLSSQCLNLPQTCEFYVSITEVALTSFKSHCEGRLWVFSCLRNSRSFVFGDSKDCSRLKELHLTKLNVRG